jgi:intracellular sulfur oxidation DsrE/DsrF family protein
MLMTHPSFLALVAFGFAISPGPGAAPDKPKEKGEKPVLKAVIHINFADSERQKHGLKNIRNILKEVEGAAEIVVVCHGAGIDLLVKEKSQHAEEVGRLIKEKVRFTACENTLRDKSIPIEKLLPGVTTIPSGAVDVIRKQQEGFGYFKP